MFVGAPGQSVVPEPTYALEKGQQASQHQGQEQKQEVGGHRPQRQRHREGRDHRVKKCVMLVIISIPEHLLHPLHPETILYRLEILQQLLSYLILP